MPLAPGARLGAYEVLSLLGAGGMGEVYRARDTRLNRDVAIKVLPDAFARDADRLARFKREAQVLASLNHPHIAAIHGLEEGASGSALVLELVEGATLADRIAHGRIPVDEALPIARQLAEALEAAHEHGIIHRDLKPSNIKLTVDGHVKVLDFGLAKALGPAASSVGPNFSSVNAADMSASPTITSPAITMGGVILGTAAYMSPEQAKGKAADKRSDIWAFGCVVYEMLTGRRAFEGEDISDTVAAILRGEPDWTALPKEVPGPIALLLRRCLEKNCATRVSDIGAARFVMAEIPALQSTATSAGATGTRRRTVSLLAALAATYVAVTALAAWAMFGRATPTSMPIRYTIVPPPSEPLLIQEADRNIAIAPDGSFLVYRVAAAGQTPHLAIRRVDQLEAKVLNGTAGGRNPFVSADGQWIGFWAAGELKKISVAGGSPLTLWRTAYVLRGATWSVDDTIVFGTTDPRVGLLKLSGSGGEPEIVTKIDGEHGEADHVLPAFLPGFRQLLFTMTALGQPGNAGQIVALDLETGQRKVLVRDGSQPEYVDSGHLVYASAGALNAVRFDPSRLEFLGPPAPVVEQVMTATNGSANYAVSRTGTLAYVPGTTAVTRRALAWVDRQGRTETIKGPDRGLADPRLSADGRRIALEIIDDGDDVWTFDLTRGALEKKTFEPGEDETVAWSPDGKWIAYSSSRGEQRLLMRRRADGSGPEERVWSARISDIHVHLDQWIDGGRTLLMSTAAANSAPADIATLAVDGDGNRMPKTILGNRFNERGARVSPDGRWIAYSSNESGRDEVYVQPYPSLDGKWQVSTNGGSQPVWSKKGDELFYRGDGLMAVRVLAGASFTPSPPQKLFDDRYHNKGVGHTGYDVSLDGQKFLMILPGSVASPSTIATINVVVSWLDELRDRIPAKH